MKCKISTRKNTSFAPSLKIKLGKVTANDTSKIRIECIESDMSKGSFESRSNHITSWSVVKRYCIFRSYAVKDTAMHTLNKNQNYKFSKTIVM